MRSDHLSKHLKTHLSSKKTEINQTQDNGMSTIVTLSGEDPVKLNHEDMIDSIALEDMSDSNKPVIQ